LTKKNFFRWLLLRKVVTAKAQEKEAQEKAAIERLAALTAGA